MIKKLKLFSSVAIIIVVILSMASCAKSADPNSSNTESQAVGNSNQTDNITDTDKISTHYNISEKYTWDDFYKYATKDCLPHITYLEYFSRYCYGASNPSEFIVSEKHSGDFDYTVYENGKAVLKEYTGQPQNCIHIPSKIDGYEVMGIGNYCFTKDSIPILNKNSIVKQVTFDSDSKLVYIAEGAFEDYCAITDITLPSSLIVLANGAFSGCKALQKIELPDKLVCIGCAAFQNCSSLRKINLPQSVEYIANNTFYECTSLESVKLSNQIEELYGNTFYHCYKLTEINIPKNIKKIFKVDFEGTKIDTSIFEKAGVEIR